MQDHEKAAILAQIDDCNRRIEELETERDRLFRSINPLPEGPKTRLQTVCTNYFARKIMEGRT